MKFIEHSTNINVSKLYIELNLKKKIFIKEYYKKKYILRKVIFSKQNGIFSKIKLNKKIKNKIIEDTFILKKGQKIKDFMNQRIAILFLKFKNKNELKKYTTNIDKYIETILK
jgi:hypothetical protein